MARKPSPSHRRRVEYQNRAHDRSQQERLLQSSEARQQAINRYVRYVGQSLTRADFTRAERALAAANVPRVDTIVIPNPDAPWRQGIFYGNSLSNLEVKPKPEAEMAIRPYKDKYPQKDYHHSPMGELVQHSLQCCGVKELHGTQHYHSFERNDGMEVKYEYRTAGEFIRDAQKQYKLANRHRPFWLFTEARPKGKEHTKVPAFSKYITDNDLGDVTVLGPRWNGNSTNWVMLAVWQMDEKQAARFMAHKPELPE